MRHLAFCTQSQLHLIDLKTRTPIVTVNIPGGAGYVAADEVNHRFLVEETDVTPFDNNASWRIMVYDERGRLVSQTPPIFDFFSNSIVVYLQPFQANGRLHQGFVAADNVGGSTALDWAQLQPFSYSP